MSERKKDQQIKPSHPHLTAVVDEASKVPSLGGINDPVHIHSKHVTAANALLLVPLLSHVGNLLSHNLSHILDDHVLVGDGLQSEQSPVVNLTALELQPFLASGQGIQLAQIAATTTIRPAKWENMEGGVGHHCLARRHAQTQRQRHE